MLQALQQSCIKKSIYRITQKHKKWKKKSIYPITQKHKKCWDRRFVIARSRDVWSYTEKLSKNSHIQDRLLWRKCGNAFPPLNPYAVLIKLPFRRCDVSEHKNVGRFSSNGFGATYRLPKGTDCVVFKKQNIFHLMNFRQQQERENATFFTQ